MKNIFYLCGTLFLLIAMVYVITPPEKLFQLGISTERGLAGLTLRTININEGEIAYLEGGTGKTLILLHGFGADKDNWNRLAMHLTSDYHIIALDLPGFGGSFKNINLDYDISPQVNRLNEFIEKLNLTQFHIGGNSMGGYIAGNYAAVFPNKILSLWLIDTLGVAAAPNSEMFEMISQKQRPVVLTKNLTEYEKLISFVFHHPPFMPGFFVDELAKQAEQNYVINSKIFEDIHHISDFQVNLTSPLDTVLINFSKPVLITWGKQDRILHPDGAKLLASVMPRSEVQLMENTGHLPMIEAAAATAEQFILFDNVR